jgi:hypothetical protein
MSRFGTVPSMLNKVDDMSFVSVLMAMSLISILATLLEEVYFISLNKLSKVEFVIVKELSFAVPVT